MVTMFKHSPHRKPLPVNAVNAWSNKYSKAIAAAHTGNESRRDESQWSLWLAQKLRKSASTVTPRQ